jgi:hypothetical protein
VCTLALWTTLAGERVVFANRDERLDRPSLPPRVEPGPPRVLAPVDVQEGGTWLGLNEHGLFVGVTNRSGAARDPSRRSRGALVRDALTARSAVELRERLERVEEGEHNPFHLLYLDRERAFLSWDDGVAVHHVDVSAAAGDFSTADRAATAQPLSSPPPLVDAGGAGGQLVVVTERGHAWDATRPRGEREAFVRRAWAELPADRRDDLQALVGLLARHADDPANPLDGACVHADAFGYGTRSTFAMALGRDAAATRALWVEGKPCVTPASDLGAELAALR